MRARMPPSRGRLPTVIITLLVAAVGLAGCVNPTESGNGDPDVGPDAVHDEQTFNQEIGPDTPLDVGVGITRDSGNVEAVLTLNDARAGATGGATETADTNESAREGADEATGDTNETADPDANETGTTGDANETGTNDDAGAQDGANETQTGEPGPVTVALRLVVLAPNGDEVHVLEELEVELEAAEGGVHRTIEASLENGFWEEVPEDAGLIVRLQGTADDGPVQVIGHIRSFQ